MEALVEFISQNPLYGAGIVLGVVILLIALAKKMLKLAIVAIVLTAAYVYYLHDMAEETYSKAEKKFEDVRDSADQLIDDTRSLLK